MTVDKGNQSGTKIGWTGHELELLRGQLDAGGKIGRQKAAKSIGTG
jgi:hypothetical protein